MSGELVRGSLEALGDSAAVLRREGAAGETGTVTPHPRTRGVRKIWAWCSPRRFRPQTHMGSEVENLS